MKHIRLCKVYGLRWSDGEVHCERCGGLHEGFLRNLVLPELRRLGGCYDCRIGKNQDKGL